MPAKQGVQLTDVFLRKLKPSGRREEISDATERGLRVRVSAAGDISFILKCRGADSKPTTVTLGRYPDLTLKEARERAAKNRQALKDGAPLNEAKRGKRHSPAVAFAEVTLRDLVSEYEGLFSTNKKIWSPAGPKTKRSEARGRIETVFASLLDRPVEELAESDFAKAVTGYKPLKPVAGKNTANGQVSRARAYLMPVLDWAAGRKRFSKSGSARVVQLAIVDLHNVVDPASDDHTITGERDRVLYEEELRAVLPFLRYPAPKLGKLRASASKDYRPIAMRFMLFTAARREEIHTARWKDIDFANKVWRKPDVKSTRGGPRGQALPLSDAAIEILSSLPNYVENPRDKLVFPNSAGGYLGNWDRFQKALCKASGTNDWHRHDLRRTAATLMHALQIPVTTIEKILAHTDPLKRENVSGAASAYMRMTHIMTSWKDPQAEALNQLAAVLHLIESGATGTLPG